MNIANGLKQSLTWVTFVALLTACALLIYPRFFSNRNSNMEKVHVLKHPLLLGSEDNAGYHLLPTGTTLYYEHSMPEGFSTYRIYVNVEGGSLPLEENTPSGAIKPTSALFIDKAQLLSLLEDVRLKSTDLDKILSNGNFSSVEKEEILDYLKKRK